MCVYSLSHGLSNFCIRLGVSQRLVLCVPFPFLSARFVALRTEPKQRIRELHASGVLATSSVRWPSTWSWVPRCSTHGRTSRNPPTKCRKASSIRLELLEDASVVCLSSRGSGFGPRAPGLSRGSGVGTLSDRLIGNWPFHSPSPLGLGKGMGDRMDDGFN